MGNINGKEVEIKEKAKEYIRRYFKKVRNLELGDLRINIFLALTLGISNARQLIDWYVHQSIERSVVTSFGNLFEWLALEVSGGEKETASKNEKYYVLANKLYQFFGDLIDNHKEDKVNEISGVASELFLEMTPKQTFEGVKVSESYEVFVRDKHDEYSPADRPSAGETDMVSLAFLMALNKAGTGGSLIILDHPSLNLDPVPKERFFSALKEFGFNQAIVTGFEEDLQDSLGDRASKAYKLSTVEGKNASKIKGVK